MLIKMKKMFRLLFKDKIADFKTVCITWSYCCKKMLCTYREDREQTEC